MLSSQDCKLRPGYQKNCRKRGRKKIISTFSGFLCPCFQIHVHFFTFPALLLLDDSINQPESVCNKLPDINISPFKLALPFISYGTVWFHSLFFSLPNHLSPRMNCTLSTFSLLLENLNRCESNVQKVFVMCTRIHFGYESSNAFKHIKLAVEQ